MNLYEYETTTPSHRPRPPRRLSIGEQLQARQQEDAARQVSLFDLLGADAPPLREPDYGDAQTTEERFAAFHAANPHVYASLRDMALTLKAQGTRQYGMKALFEVLRFNNALRTNGDAFKLNNNYTALYARKLMDEVVGLEGFFETRERG